MTTRQTFKSFEELAGTRLLFSGSNSEVSANEQSSFNELKDSVRNMRSRDWDNRQIHCEPWKRGGINE